MLELLQTHLLTFGFDEKPIVVLGYAKPVSGIEQVLCVSITAYALRHQSSISQQECACCNAAFMTAVAGANCCTSIY